MLNVDIKILSKTLAKRLTEVLSCLISAQLRMFKIGTSAKVED